MPSGANKGQAIPTVVLAVVCTAAEKREQVKWEGNSLSIGAMSGTSRAASTSWILPLAVVGLVDGAGAFTAAGLVAGAADRALRSHVSPRGPT